METSVSPLVSRILNPTRVWFGSEFYKLNKVDEYGAIVADFGEKADVHDLSFYAPRATNACGIVVTIGNENYVVKSTLDLCFEKRD